MAVAGNRTQSRGLSCDHAFSAEKAGAGATRAGSHGGGGGGITQVIFITKANEQRRESKRRQVAQDSAAREGN